jgi:hypothetical protein
MIAMMSFMEVPLLAQFAERACAVAIQQRRLIKPHANLISWGITLIWLDFC